MTLPDGPSICERKFYLKALQRNQRLVPHAIMSARSHLSVRALRYPTVDGLAKPSSKPELRDWIRDGAPIAHLGLHLPSQLALRYMQSYGRVGLCANAADRARL